MTDRLVTSANLEDADAFYAAYVAAHEGLPAEASELLNARLALILANQVGHRQVLEEAIRLAKSSLPVGSTHKTGER
ncbi:MAG: DUF2783 domain-containing protein [Geminicoccaceae bacterium]